MMRDVGRWMYDRINFWNVPGLLWLIYLTVKGPSLNDVSTVLHEAKSLEEKTVATALLMGVIGLYGLGFLFLGIGEVIVEIRRLRREMLWEFKARRASDIGGAEPVSEAPFRAEQVATADRRGE